MGADSAKAHQTYTVAPSTLPDDAPLDAPPTAVVDGHLQPPVEAFVEEIAVPAAPAVDGPLQPPGGAPLTPIPDAPTCGDAAGTPLLVGGADLEDSTATLVAYDSPDGPREVLTATVNAGAETKLLEALALTDQHLIPVSVQQQQLQRPQIDRDLGLYEQAVTVAKSVNHHLKAGDDIPAHTHDNHQQLLAQLEQAEQAGEQPDMVAHYRAAAQQLGARLQPGYATAYGDGGKVDLIDPYQIPVTVTVTVTEMVPAPADQTDDPALLPTTIRRATRIRPALADAQTSWDGTSRAKATGHEYAIDLGDGFRAVYRPHTAAPDRTAVDYSHRGALEIIAPAGGGHSGQLVDRLGQLHLVNRTMTAQEGEWAYLQRNITAQRLGGDPHVRTALDHAAAVEDAHYFELIAERQHDAVGLDAAQLDRFSRQLVLDAQARALTDRVQLVRDGVAKATGLADGAALGAHPGYDPHPHTAAGWLQWTRFDVAGDPATVTAAFNGRSLSHSLSADRLVGMMRNGGTLTCTERRRRMGVTEVGMSEGSDMRTGGAKSVFLRVASKPSHVGLYWDDPATLLRRSDWYGYDGDHFGALNPDDAHYQSGKLTRDPAAVAGFTAHSNEIMFANGIDLTGADAPSRIRCGTADTRSSVLAALTAQGLTHLGGRPVDQVVTT